MIRYIAASRDIYIHTSVNIYVALEGVFKSYNSVVSPSTRTYGDTHTARWCYNISLIQSFFTGEFVVARIPVCGYTSIDIIRISTTSGASRY